MKYIMTVLLGIMCCTIFSFAGELQEHDIIKPIPGSKLRKFYEKGFKRMEFRVNKDKGSEKIEVQGETYKYEYIRENFSNVEILENYKKGIEAKGYKLVYRTPYILNAKLIRENGKIVWVRIKAVSSTSGKYSVIIVETGEVEQTLVLGEDKLKKELEKNGKIALYGILFDTGKAVLQTESLAQLKNITDLLKNNRDLNIEIQGHTDNVGDDKSNMILSEKRANTVKTYLELFGIKKEQIIANGYGESKPIAENNTEEGRAKNRRVELVKIK